MVADTFKIETCLQSDSKQPGEPNLNPHSEIPQNGNPHMT